VTVWLLFFSSATAAHLVTAMATTVWLSVLPVIFSIAATVLQEMMIIELPVILCDQRDPSSSVYFASRQ
jgi:hypothetical protein